MDIFALDLRSVCRLQQVVALRATTGARACAQGLARVRSRRVIRMPIPKRLLLLLAAAAADPVRVIARSFTGTSLDVSRTLDVEHNASIRDVKRFDWGPVSALVEVSVTNAGGTGCTKLMCTLIDNPQLTLFENSPYKPRQQLTY